MSERDIDALFGRVSDTVHATMYGMLALSLLRGLLGATMYRCTGGWGFRRLGFGH